MTEAERFTPDELEKHWGFFPIFGSLFRFRERIYSLMPEHRRYVEVFCGHGEAIWYKPRVEEEILCDIDPVIVRLLRICKTLSDADITRLCNQYDWVGKRETFLSLRASRPRTRLGWFYRQLYLRRFSRKGNRVDSYSFNRSYTGINADYYGRLHKCRERLQGVKILRLDYRESLKRFDSPSTLFFADPPFPGTEADYGSEDAEGRGWGIEPLDYDEMAERLSRARGKVLVVIRGPAKALRGFRKSFKEIRFRWPNPHAVIGWPGVDTPYRIGSFFFNYTPPKQPVVVEAPPAPVKKRFPAEYLDYPEGDERALPWSYQHHWRGGKSVHGDFRFSQGEYLIGFTLAVQLPGLDVPELSDIKTATVEAARAASRKLQDKFKVNPATGEFARRIIAGGIERRTQILAFPKAPQPLGWLDLETVSKPGEVGATRTLPGVIELVDSGTYTPGARKPSIWEIFIEDSKRGVFKGRYFLRPLQLAQPRKAVVLPPAEEQDIPGIVLELIQPDSQLPNVFAESSRIERPWVPPQGWSALPSYLRERVPAHLRYWTRPSEAERMRLRDELYAQWEAEGIIAALERGEPIEKIVPAPGGPRVPSGGPQDAVLAIIGDGPGAVEVREGKPLVGPSGQFLRDLLRTEGVDPDSIWWGNVYERAGLPITDPEIARQGLERLGDLRKLPQLRAILALGKLTAQAFLGIKGPIQRARAGNPHRGGHLPAPVVATYHPAALLRTGREKSAFFRAFRGDLRRSLELAGLRPAKGHTPPERAAQSSSAPQLKARSGSFVLQRRSWRVREVVRIGPAQVYWHLRFDWGGRYAPALLLESDPLRTPVAIGTYDPQASRAALEREGTFDVADIDEPKPAEVGQVLIERLDSGPAELIEESPEQLLIRLAGKQLKGIFRVRSEGGGLWSFAKMETAVKGNGRFRTFAEIVHHEEQTVAKRDGTQEKRRLIYGVVYKPYVIDAQGDWADEATIERAAHRWMLESREYNLMHRINGAKVRPVESYIAPQDVKIGRRIVPAGSWVLVSKVFDDEIWAKVERGELRGYSLEGRSLVREEAPPRV